MFQPWFVELVSVLSDCLVGLSALILACIGIIGLTQWRTELTGKTKFEVARKMALLAFQFRDEFRQARNPFTFPGESADRQRNDSETREEAQVLDEYFARRKRLRPLQETLKNLHAASWEAEVILDENIGKLIRPVEGAFKELFAAIEVYFQMQLEGVRGGRRHPEPDHVWLQSQFEQVYGTGDDEVSQSIDAAVNALVEALKTHTK